MKLITDDTETVTAHFKHTFGQNPLWCIKTPGRVNLIGEHTDYNQLPVLPMPLQQAITFQTSPTHSSAIKIVNASADHPPIEFDLHSPPAPYPAGHWGNYCRAAILATTDHLRNTGHTAPLLGFHALAASTLPEAAGLSSSSALVISTCLALLTTNGIRWTMQELAEQMRLAENYAGTAGGGMDQAVIALGQPDSALLIQFDPLTVAPVPLPPSLRIFVINSGHKARKTGTARYSYNRRALECAIGVELLRQSAAPLFDTTHWRSLKDVYTTCHTKDHPWSALALQAIGSRDITLHTLQQSLSLEKLRQLCASKNLNLDEITEWLPDGIFQVLPRVTHVLNETDRVYSFRDALLSGDLQKIFFNATESHASLRDLYHVSTPEIENLIHTTLQCGAGAARITGAGFGGCIVAFVEKTHAPDFTRNLSKCGIPTDSIIEARSAGPARITPIAHP